MSKPRSHRHFDDESTPTTHIASTIAPQRSGSRSTSKARQSGATVSPMQKAAVRCAAPRATSGSVPVASANLCDGREFSVRLRKVRQRVPSIASQIWTAQRRPTDRAFKDEDLGDPNFERALENFYRRRQGTALDGMKVWPDRSPLSGLATKVWDSHQ